MEALEHDDDEFYLSIYCVYINFMELKILPYLDSPQESFTQSNQVDMVPEQHNK